MNKRNRKKYHRQIQRNLHTLWLMDNTEWVHAMMMQENTFMVSQSFYDRVVANVMVEEPRSRLPGSIPGEPYGLKMIISKHMPVRMEKGKVPRLEMGKPHPLLRANAEFENTPNFYHVVNRHQFVAPMIDDRDIIKMGASG